VHGENPESNEREADAQRLDELAQRHGLAYRKRGKNSYQFDDRTGEDAFSDGCIFIARGLREALAFAEGFDRAKGRKTLQQNEGELRKLATFTAALRESRLLDA
jgi:hypothetical protein